MSLKFPVGLRFKLVVLVVLGISTAFTIIGWVRVHNEEQGIIAEMQRSGRERVATMAEAVANLLIGYDYSNMEALAERLVQQPDVQHAVIRNEKGKVMVTRSTPKPSGQETLSFNAPVYFDGRMIGTVSLELSLARMESEIARTYRSVVLEQVFFGLLLGLLIYFATSQVIVKPITRISRHMQGMIESDEATTPEAIDIDSRDEIGDLARIFNELNRKVYEAQRRLQQKIDLAGTALMETNKQLQQRTLDLEKRTQDLEKVLALVEKLAVTDSLTELRNRRYFDDTLATAFARSQRYHEELTLILLDVDHFKGINDTYGHAAGDLVLQRLARIFKERCREIDVAARLGEDEFAFLLFHTSREDSEVFAHDLLKLAHEQRFVFNGNEVRIGLSIGLASVRDDIQSIEALYGAADEALYEAKRRGRNQVVIYPFTPCTEPAEANIVALHLEQKESRT